MPAVVRHLGLILLAGACLALGACAHQPRGSRDAYGYGYDERYGNGGGNGGGYGSGSYDNRGNAYPGGNAQVQYGQVRSIEQEYGRGGRERAEATGGGAVAGAIIGGVIGNQLGRDDDRGRRGYGGRGPGRGGDRDGDRAAATVIGAIGGALIGNAIERQAQNEEATRGRGTVFHVLVRMDDRSERWFDFERLDGLRVGDRVRVENGRLQRW